MLDTDDLSAIFGIDIAPLTLPAVRNKAASVAKPPADGTTAAAATKPAIPPEPTAVARPAVRKKPKARIAPMSAAKRASITKRMKEFWEARRKLASVTKPAAKAFTWSGDRAAVSKRMKEYWAARRRAKG